MRDIIKAIKDAQIPYLGVSREEIMHYILEHDDHEGLTELRQACREFELKNPNKGSDEEVDRLVDGNLYWMCRLADEFAGLNGIPYEQRARLALRRSTKMAEKEGGGAATNAYKEVTGYIPVQETRSRRKSNDYRSN